MKWSCIAVNPNCALSFQVEWTIGCNIGNIKSVTFIYVHRCPLFEDACNEMCTVHIYNQINTIQIGDNKDIKHRKESQLLLSTAAARCTSFLVEREFCSGCVLKRQNLYMHIVSGSCLTGCGGCGSRQEPTDGCTWCHVDHWSFGRYI